MDIPGTTEAVEKDRRLDRALSWLRQQHVEIQSDFHSVAGDASFRRYFRLNNGDHSVILMDAPPDRETSEPFVEIDQRLRKAGMKE